MLSLRLRSILNLFFAAILIAIIGCGGMSNTASNPSHPAAPPPGGNPGGSGGGGGTGGGSPQSSTFVYVNNWTVNGSPVNTFAFRFNNDGSFSPVSGSPFSNPQGVQAQSGKFLVGNGPANSNLTLYSVDSSTGAPQSAVSSADVALGGVLADAANVYVGNGNGLYAFSVNNGTLTPVPGSPFDATPPAASFQNDLSPLAMIGSLIFTEQNTVKDAGGINVYARDSRGALTLRGHVGQESPAATAIHPSGRFIYKLDTCCLDNALNVYSFDANSGASALVQQVPLPLNDFPNVLAVDALGKYLFLLHRGIRVFALDQSSGKLTEVSGSPFFGSDSAITWFKPDPSGRFLLVVRGNTLQTVSVNSANGVLTPVIAPVTIGTRVNAITFATF